MKTSKPYIKNSYSFFLKYFSVLSVSFHDSQSLFGFCILLTVFSQLFTGTMLSFSLIPEPMLIPIMRDEEDLEDLYTDDFFWLHERGVDLLFIFSWFHLFRKLYIGAYEYEHEIAWKSGVYTFLILQVVTFFGLVLCCTHLSEITLTIAANIMHTFFLFHGKVYWIIFTDKSLNSDTVIRLAFAHYLSAFFMAYMGVLHSFDMHYDWKTENFENNLEYEILWWDEALSNEFGVFLELIVLIGVCGALIYAEPETLSYELFMWGDIGMMTDIRFYGVAPHWYFRPFMAWLIVCPHHKTGIFGLIFFFFILFHQPTLHGNNEHNNMYRRKLIINSNSAKIRKFYKNNNVSNDTCFYFQFFYLLFLLSAFYCASFLPYGRFYNRVGGNIGMLFSYFYLFCYLTFPVFRKNIYFYMILILLENKINFLTNGNVIKNNLKMYNKKNYNYNLYKKL